MGNSDFKVPAPVDTNEYFGRNLSTVRNWGMVLAAGVIVILSLTACNGAKMPEAITNVFTGREVEPTQIVSSIQTPFLPEAPTAVITMTPDDHPSGSDAIENQNAVPERGPVTMEDVKNIKPAAKINVDSGGQLSGLPDGSSQELLDSVKKYYALIQKKFPTSDVYYQEDSKGSGQWVLYAVLSGNLFYQTVMGNQGGEQYCDYPISYSPDSTKVTGYYTLLAIPGELNVIWKNGLPQFLAGKAKLANGDAYYSKYLDYKMYVADGDPWKEISGVTAMVESEAPQYEPGTVVLNPDYSFNGQIEIMDENNQAFYDNFLDSIIRINRDYFKALQTKEGVAVTDTESLKTYLKENNWLVPPGLQIPIKSGDLSVELSEPISEQVSLKNLDISVIQVSEYNNVKNGYIRDENLFTVYSNNTGSGGAQKGLGLGIGFTIHKETDYDTVSLIIARRTTTGDVGFPPEGQALSDENIKLFNKYLSFILYVARTMQTNPPTQLTPTFSSDTRYTPFVDLINPSNGIGTVGPTDTFFEHFIKNPVTDSAPEIIKLK